MCSKTSVVMNSIFLLILIFRFGHCVNQTLTELEDWKNEIKAELENEIFEELAETAEIRRIDSKLNEITKSNLEIITAVQDHGIKLNSLQELIEKLRENPGKEFTLNNYLRRITTESFSWNLLFPCILLLRNYHRSLNIVKTQFYRNKEYHRAPQTCM